MGYILKLSQYVYIIPINKKENLLFNSYNHSIYIIENDVEPNEYDLKELDYNDFFISDDDVKKELNKKIVPSSLEIIIEPTSNCNLNCVYCYQHNWNKTYTMNKETINNIVDYIENCFKLRKYKRLVINYMGGEPLLAKDVIINSYGLIRTLCLKYNVELYIAIDTNGTLLNKKFMNFFGRIHLSVTLSAKEDHNSKRGEYEKILNNLIQIKDTDDYSLSIRYNVDQDNINDFDGFIKELKSYGLIFSVETAFTENRNCYKNSLPKDTFRKWNSTTAIDILVNNELRVKQKPSLMINNCIGYTNDNIKIYANGIVTNCNGDYPIGKTLNIKDIKDNPDKCNLLIKNKISKLCDDCRERLLCGGMLICREHYCDYSPIILSSFLKTYAKYVNIGKNCYFDF